MTTLNGTARFDAAVLANGAWLGKLAKGAGVRVPVAAGRGYSFTVSTATPLPAPWYLPKLRVVGTPAPGGMRGMTLGPVTGRLLAGLIATGTRPAVLEPFNPCR